MKKQPFSTQYPDSLTSKIHTAGRYNTIIFFSFTYHHSTECVIISRKKTYFKVLLPPYPIRGKTNWLTQNLILH